MSSDAERDEIRRRVVTGELTRDDPEVHAWKRRDPEGAAELREAERLLGMLDDAARIEEEDIAEARARMATRVERRTSRAPRWLAAAVLVVATAALLTVAVDPGRPTAILGDGPVEILHPKGAVESFEEFRWNGRAAYFEIAVFDRQGNRLGGPGYIEGNSWRPDPTEVARWPREIEWTLTPFERIGDPGTALSASASR